MTAWLLVRGTGTGPLARDVDPAQHTAHSSTRRPAIQRGDRALLYAAVWQAVFAEAEIAGDPEHDPTRERWGWRFQLRTRVWVASLEHAPPVEAAGVLPRSLGRHSYVRLTDDQFERGRAAVVRAVVESGYDAIAPRYQRWAAASESPVRTWVRRLLGRLPAGARVLDLGCGNGSVAAVLVGAGHEVVGVDVSRAQLALARRAVPAMRTLHADALEVELDLESFDAVVCTFVFGHVPRDRQAELLARIASWLRPGGWLLLTMGVGGSEDAVERDWLGAPMFFASFDPDANAALVRGAGLDVVDARVVPNVEPGHGVVSFQWFLARA